MCIRCSESIKNCDARQKLTLVPRSTLPLYVIQKRRNLIYYGRGLSLSKEERTAIRALASKDFSLTEITKGRWALKNGRSQCFQAMLAALYSPEPGRPP